MAEVKWIKIVTDIFSNRKIKQIEAMPDADSILVIWFKILCLAGNINENGLILITKDIPYTDEMLANEFKKPINTIRMALQLFEKFKMIELSNNIYCVSNWEKYQNVDTLEKIREQTRIRVAKYKQKQKLLTDGNVKVTLPVTHGNAIDIDKDIDKEIKDICGASPQTHKFTPPTVEEIKAYCSERQNRIDPQKFHDFYTSKGWMVGKNKMKDWKAAVRNWEKSTGVNASNKPANCGNFEQRQYSDDYFDSLYENIEADKSKT